MLPEMTVEKRESTTAHKLHAPFTNGMPPKAEQLQDMLVLCQDAKADNASYTKSTLDILGKYAPFGLTLVEERVRSVTQFHDWAECVDFVRDDECIDFAVMVAKYAKRVGTKPRADRGFIDGGGLGYYKRWGDRTKRTLEKAFDAKYFFKTERPLIELTNQLGEKADCIVNYIHPGHWAFPAGHGAKFYETVDLARDTWDLTTEQDAAILTTAYVLSMARSGGGVHYPCDNVASGYLAGLPEFKQYGE